jgi:hypothetical protein
MSGIYEELAAGCRAVNPKEKNSPSHMGRAVAVCRNSLSR